MFYSIKNLVSMETRVVEKPWELKPYDYPPGLTKDEAKTRFWKNPAFEHHFISCYSGLVPNLICSAEADNPPAKMYGILVDYDATLTDADIEKLKTESYGLYLPAYVSRSFSGNARLFWAIEAPVMIASKSQCAKFREDLAKHLQLIKWHAGFDAKAWANQSQYYELGRDWTPLHPDAKIPKSFLDLWLWEASKGLNLDDPSERQVTIPIEEVAAEVERRYPGRWNGPFEVGARGVRFWDPTADNETGARVRENGMQCFTGNQGNFVPWRTIFGRPWVDKFEAARVGNILENIVYDGKQFHIFRDGVWKPANQTVATRWLATMGLSSKAPKGATASEIDEAIVKICLDRTVVAALPVLYRPHGLWVYRGVSILNTSTIRPMTPAPEGSFVDFEGATKRSFPFLWSFLTSVFAPIGGKAYQLEYFLAWAKQVYQGAYLQEPTAGHAVALAGPAGAGKTLLSKVIMSNILGGATDASQVLLSGSQFSSELATWPVVLVDDPVVAKSPHAHERFTALLKHLVANRAIRYEKKHVDATETEFNGRAMLCCNTDPESIRALPFTDSSIGDKLSLLLVNDMTGFKWPGNGSHADVGAVLAHELPGFCRFLLEMPYPEHWLDKMNPRFLLKTCKHPTLLQYTRQSGRAYPVFEMILGFLDRMREGFPDRKCWEGTASQLISDLAADNAVLVNKYTSHTLGIALNQLVELGLDIKKEGTSRGVVNWKIPLDLAWTPSMLEGESGAQRPEPASE